MRNLKLLLITCLLLFFAFHAYIYAHVSAEQKSDFMLISGGVFTLAIATTMIGLTGLTKKMSLFVSEMRQAAGNVTKSSLVLSDASRKLSQQGQLVLNSFERSVVAVENINRISQQNRESSAKTHEQSKHGEDAALQSQSSVELICHEMKNLSQDSNKIRQIASAIDEIAFQTNLLALNATVEAARAGEHGRGFAVVAEAVRSLAQQSATATKEIREITDAVLTKTAKGAQFADDGGKKIGEVLRTVSAATHMTKAISDATNEESTQISEVSRSLKEIETQTQTNVALAQKSSGISKDLSNQAVIFESMLGNLSDLIDANLDSPQIKAHLEIARGLARQTQAVMEAAIAAGDITLSDLLSIHYKEVTADHASQLSYLFDVSKVTAEGFMPKKYVTNYDRAIDLKLQPIFDKALQDNSDYLFALPSDLNAYACIHNSKSCKAWTGIPSQDLAGNRAKRFFNDNLTFLSNARVALLDHRNAGSELPPLVPSREEFQRLGCSLKESKALRAKYLVQTYLRDTGELATNISVPIFVHGERYGSVLLCWLEKHS